MRITSGFSRRHLFAGLGALSVSTVAVACSNEANSDKPAGRFSLSVIDRAPVASSEEIASSPTAAAIKQRGQLLVGGEVDLPLLSQQNPTTGETEGFDAVLAKLLAKYIIGQPAVKTVKLTPETREPLLAIGTVDAVIRIYTITPERAKNVTFAGPYLKSGQAIATLKSKNGMSNPASLNGARVGAVLNTTSVGAITQQAPQANISTFGTAAECVQALEQGATDAYVHDLTLLAGAAQLNNKIQITGEPFTNEPYGIGLQHGDEGFKQFVNRWLKKIEDGGLWRQMWQESLGTVVAGEPPTPPAIGSAAGT